MRVAKAGAVIMVVAGLTCCSGTPPPPPPPPPKNATGPCTPGILGFTSIHEFALQPNSFPSGIAAGPDGNVWFTENVSNRIGQITHQGAISEFSISPGSNPNGIALGSDGNLWFAETNANKIGVMTAAGVLSAEYAIPTANSDTRFITEGPDGNVWFTETVANKVGRITPAGAIIEFALPGPYGSGPQRITSGPDGNLWLTYDSNPYAVVRLTPVGTITQFPVPQFYAIVGGQKVPIAMLPNGITTGPGANLWVASDANAIFEVTPSGTFVNTYPVAGGSAYNGPGGVAFAPDGRVYFTASSGSAVGWIELGGSFGYYLTPSIRSEPQDITVGPDKNLWFTETFAQKIGCLAPKHY
jgi:virginiamycin B lyase